MYGWTTSPEATRVINASPWADSCLRDEKGLLKIDTYYAYHAKDPKGINLLTYPAPGNHRFTLGMDQLRFFIEECGLDGVYIDQFSLAFGTADRYTYEKWDGHTVDIDPATFRITRRYTDCALVGGPARKAWVEYVLGKGKTVVANTEPAVMETQALRTFRFMETQGYNPLAEGPPDQPGCAEGQLASPIGLGHSFGAAGARQGEFLTRTVIAHLRYGLLYYYYGVSVPETGPGAGQYGPLNHMFPFTPVELHEGWMVGKERIITCLSGTYHWPAAGRPKVLHFDPSGRQKDSAGQVRMQQKAGGWNVTVTLEDWHEIVVIEAP